MKKSENLQNAFSYIYEQTLKISSKSENIVATSLGKGVALLANWLLNNDQKKPVPINLLFVSQMKTFANFTRNHTFIAFHFSCYYLQSYKLCRNVGIFISTLTPCAHYLKLDQHSAILIFELYLTKIISDLCPL